MHNLCEALDWKLEKGKAAKLGGFNAAVYLSPPSQPWGVGQGNSVVPVEA